MAAAAQASKRAVLGLRASVQSVQGLQHSKPVEFFREVARCVPTVVKQYKLEELTSVPELRSNLAVMFRKYSDVRSPQVVDMLIYKGREELESIMLNHKQRHHLIAEYVHDPMTDKVKKPSGLSPFLESFYKSN